MNKANISLEPAAPGAIHAATGKPVRSLPLEYLTLV